MPGGVLFVNPRSGSAEPSVEELRAAASELGVGIHVLAPGEDVEQLATSVEASALGVAGGDGSLGPVAKAAILRDLPFVCVPAGTRNHFAGDVGIEPDPIAALSAFRDGVERRVDVGWVGERVFLNNVSLGMYARLVHRRERRRRRGEALARLRALLVSFREHRRTERFVIDGEPVRASVVLVANNEYKLDLFSVGTREDLDEGVLAVYAARGLRRLEWTERCTESLVVETARSTVRAAIDGEPVTLVSPLELRSDPGALRLLLPHTERGEAPDGVPERLFDRVQSPA